MPNQCCGDTVRESDRQDNTAVEQQPAIGGLQGEDVIARRVTVGDGPSSISDAVAQACTNAEQAAAASRFRKALAESLAKMQEELIEKFDRELDTWSNSLTGKIATEANCTRAEQQDFPRQVSPEESLSEESESSRWMRHVSLVDDKTEVAVHKTDNPSQGEGHVETPGTGTLSGFDRLRVETPGSLAVDDCDKIQSDNARRYGLSSSMSLDTHMSMKLDKLLRGRNSLQSWAKLGDWQSLTDNMLYKVFFGPVIILSCVFLGWQVDYEANHNGEVHIMEHVGQFGFLIIFVVDVTLRLFCETPSGFFFGIDWTWNIFDIFVVLSMVIDEILRLAENHSFSLFRLLRLGKLLQVVRMMRQLAVFREFRVLSFTILSASAWRTFLWLSLLIGVFVFSSAIIMTEAAIDRCANVADIGGMSGIEPKMCDYFGSIGQSGLTIYESMYGGLLWADLVEALRSQGPERMLIFLGILSLAIIVLMNMVIGVVIRVIHQNIELHRENALREVDEQNDSVISVMKEIFSAIDIDESGSISTDEFEIALNDPKMFLVFSALNLAVGDLNGLFKLLDKDGEGEIEIDEFILGCLRLRGDAKALDLVMVQHQNRKLMQHMSEVRRNMEYLVRSQTNPDCALNNVWAPMARTQPSRDRQRRHRAAVTLNPQLLKDPSHTGRPIKLCEMRAVSVRELRALRTLLTERCTAEAWQDPVTGNRLKPEKVNLYHLAYHFICPTTAIHGVLLRGLEVHDKVREGQQVFQRREGWSLPVAEGVIKAKLEDGNMAVWLDAGCFQPPSHPSAGPIFLESREGSIDLGTPAEVVAPSALSYKEYVSSTPLRPKWYCSHYWGEAVLEFTACCEEHATRRCADNERDASYWVCAYANRQHDLEDEVNGSLNITGFSKAMALAEGLLLFLGRDGKPFTRIWCDFELYVTILESKKLLDIVAVTKVEKKDNAVLQNNDKAITDRRPVLLSDGALPRESAYGKSIREAQFPLSIIAKGITVKLEDGESTVETDKKRILSYLGSRVTDVNRALHSYLARAAWPQAVKRGLVERLQLPQILQADSDMTSLYMTLAHIVQVEDETLFALASAFPPNLKELRLSFQGCKSITNIGVGNVLESIPMGVKTLKLDFLGCVKVTDEGIRLLAECVGRMHELVDLRLDFANCKDITRESMHQLAVSLPSSCRTFAATFKGTEVDRNFGDVRGFQKAYVGMSRRCWNTLLCK